MTSERSFVSRQQALEGSSLHPAPHAFRISAGPRPNLDPALEGGGNWAIDLLYSGLVEESLEESVAPEAAFTWDVLDGGHKYVFHLRDDWHWSDGAPLTAGDFEYAWKRTLDPATGAPLAGLLYDIKGAEAFHQGQSSDPGQVGVRALDDATLVVELERPTGHFLHMLTQVTAYPVPRHVVEAHGEAWTQVDNLVTNGPFRLEAWQPEQSVLFSRNPAYPGRFRGNVQQVHVSILPREDRPARQLEMYEADRQEFLSLSGYPPAERDRVRERHAGEYHSAPQLATSYLAFNVSRPPFADRRVRRAFVLATDRETLATVTGKGYDSPATGGFVPPGMPGHAAGIALPYDPQEARRLLAQAGYPDGAGFPATMARTYNPQQYMCEDLHAQWRENLGVEVALQTLDFATFADSLETDPPGLYFFGWIADYPDPDSFLRVGVDTIRRSASWSDEAFDRLVERARRTIDQAERSQLFGQAEEILVEEACIVPLFYSHWQFLLKPWAGTPPLSPLGSWLWKDCTIEPH